MNKNVFHFFGIFLVFIGGCMCLPLFIALYYREYHAAAAFLISIALCLIPGIIVRIIFKQAVTAAKLNLRDSYLLVAGSWILATVFGALPYLLSGATSSISLAFFETASGFSTTGATIFPRVEDLPHCILIWRSLTQWLGGMGMIVLFFALLPKFGAKANTISRAETPGPIQRRISSKYSASAQKLYLAYIILTALLFILLLFGGMTPFDAIAHAFTTMATGGFSTHTGGLSYWGSSYIYWVIAGFGFLAGTNFAFFFDILAGKIKSVFKDQEFRMYLLIIGLATLFIGISLHRDNACNTETGAIGSALFQVINTISTLGFETGNTAWPPFSIMILVFLMIMGGCSSSTAGGVKVSRVLMLFKTVRLEISRSVQGSVVKNVKYNGKRLHDETMNYILSFVVLYVTVVGAATLIVTCFGGATPETDFLTVLSCISNLGPGLDNLGLLCDYHIESFVCVITYIFVMIAGRLEITTFLVLFSLSFRKPQSI